ncbi:hypothetical protein TNCV_2544891 [Trichonephila clavipes]|nr:hypothetical protein TNCV_2544891 [Trichonephila clavipes]
MQSRKCRSCDVWCKEAERKKRSRNTFMEQIESLFYNKCSKLTRSPLAGLTAALHGIPVVLEDSWHVTYPLRSYRFER